jgi:peptidoglycan hydrolase CwlO-like protein
MKHHFKIITVIIVVLLIVSVGFNIVFAVDATAEPGSDQDPLVSKSYVDAGVGQANAVMQKLQTQYDALVKDNEQLNIKLAAADQSIKTLLDQTKVLQDQTKAMQDEINAIKSKPAATTGTTTPNTGTGTSKGVVNASSLNVRSQANTTSSVVAGVVKNEVVTIVSKSGDWYKIKTSKGVTGFVLGKFIIVKQ